MFFGVLAVLVLGSIGSAQTEDTAKGASLLAEARKALGGEDKLAAVKRLQVKGEMRRGQGNLTLEGDTEVFLEPPDKFRRNESLSLGPGGPGIDRVEVLNGNDIWDENNGGGGRFGRGGGFGGGGRGGFRRGGNGGQQNGDADPARAQGIDPERLKELQLRNRRVEVSRLLLAFLLTTDSPVAWIGTAQSPEGTADVLEVKSSDGTATRLFLDIDDARAADDDVERRRSAWRAWWTGRRPWSRRRCRCTRRSASGRCRTSGASGGTSGSTSEWGRSRHGAGTPRSRVRRWRTSNARDAPLRIQGGERHQAAASHYPRHQRSNRRRVGHQELPD